MENPNPNPRKRQIRISETEVKRNKIEEIEDRGFRERERPEVDL